MPNHEFLFTLRLPDDGRLDEMLSELTASVLRHVGYAAEELARLAAEVRAGIAPARGAGGEYTVQFRAHGGDLDIDASQGGRDVFRASRRLP